MLTMAANVAKDKPRRFDNRAFCLGAVGLRNDGVLVSARNVAATDVVPTHHAEARVIRKLTHDSVIWVARITRSTGEWTLARPCQSCENKIKSAGVRRVVYTIAPEEWGVIQL